MALTQEQKRILVALLRQHTVEPVLAIYLFGSHVNGCAHPASDLDVAVVCHKKMTGDSAFEIKAALSAAFKCDVDLVDFLRADSVTKAQIVDSGELLFAQDPSQIAFLETRVLSEYALLNEERAGILQDILKRGSVHG